jgi:PAS domain S-box-containing protein
MSQILNSLIIGNGLEPQRVLEQVMGMNIEGHVLTFTTYTVAELSKVDREPDIIFICSDDGLTPAGIAEIRGTFPKKIYVALTEATEKDRRAFLAHHIDEVMSLAELHSPIGRRLVEKLLAIKELAAAEIRIEQSEERFRGIIEHSHDVIMLLDESATIVYTSPAFGRLLGYESWEVLGQTFFDLIHEDDRKSVESDLGRMMKVWADDGMALEYRFRRKEGTWLHFETIATNLLRTETVRAIVLNSRDVTQQKLIEEELEKYRQHLEDLVVQRTREVEEANRRAETVIATSPAALIALDDDGIITFTSGNYADIYPRSARGALSPGNHIGDAWDAVAEESEISPDEPVFWRMRSWLINPQEYIEFRRNSGAWVRLHARRIPGQKGVVIATTDISDYKRQQALLAAQSAELSSALAKEKDVVEQQRTFISMVSHEFRTPLAIIDGNAQIIEKRGDTLEKETLEKRSGTIRAAVDRLINLIETILSAHAIETGRLAISPAPCNLEKIVRAAAADQQDISPGHKIRVSARGLPDSMMLDEKIVRQMMANLLSNAVKYSPGAEKVEVKVEAEGDDALIEVTDHGVGIPENEKPRLFQKYFRASTSGGIPGSGLGLNLVKQFVELHNGSISLQSEVGEGTTVTVRLPLSGPSGLTIS